MLLEPVMQEERKLDWHVVQASVLGVEAVVHVVVADFQAYDLPCLVEGHLQI